MKNIESIYADYGDLVSKVTKPVIESRFKQIMTEMNAFIAEFDLQEYVVVNEMALMHALMDYFSDIWRLKDYQQIERANETKIKAYETQWLLRRKPLQIVKEMEDDTMFFVNEKFLLARLMQFLLADKMDKVLKEGYHKSFEHFMETLLYYLKFRRCDAQALELMLLAFQAGELIFDIDSE